MKTEITIPEPLVIAVDELAARLGKSRDEVFAEAIDIHLRRYRLSGQEIAGRLNALFEAHPEAAEMDPVLKAMQFRSLSKHEW